MQRFSEEQNQFMLYETLRKGETPNWVNVLHKTEFPDMESITKNAKRVLPATNGGKWAALLTTDDMTNGFIRDIEEGNFSPKGIDATMAQLKYWKENEDNWKKMEELKQLYRGDGGMRAITSAPKVRRRIQSIVEKVLPLLDEKRRGQKSKGGKGYIKFDITKEKLAELFDTFEELDKKEQKRYLLWLDDAFKDKRKLNEFKPFLTDNYSSKILPIIREFGWDKERNVVVETESDLSSLGFKEEGGRWKLRGYTGDVKMLRGKIFNLTQEASIKIYPRPIYSAFGTIKTIQEKKLSGKKWKIKEPFTADKAKIYLQKIISKKMFSGKFSTTKLNLMKKDTKFIHMSLVTLLDGRFEGSIVDGTLTENFLLQMEQMKFANEKYRLSFYAHKVFDKSNPYSDTYDEDSPYFLDIGDLEGWTEKGEEPQYNNFKKEILEALQRGNLEDVYKEEKQTLERNLKYLSQSISPEEKEFVDEVLEDENILDDITDDELIRTVMHLQDTPPTYKEKPIEYGEETVTVYFVEIKSTYNTIQNLLGLVGRQTEGEIKAAYEGMKEDNQEAIESFDKVLQEQGKIYDIEFNEDAFGSEYEKDIAEITYRGLAAGKALDEVLGGQVITQQIDDLDNLFNVLIAAESQYSTGERLSSISKEIIPEDDMDFNADPPPYEAEIKKFAEALKTTIPKLREAITNDIQEKVEDIVTHPKTYELKSKKQQKQNIFSILERNQLIEGVQ